MAVVDELITLIGYKLDERGAATLKQAKTEIVDMAKKVAALSIAVIAGKTAFQGWFHGVLENSMQMQRLSQDTNISAEALQQWGFAVGRMGGDAKGALSNLQAFQRGLHSVIPGQFNQGLALQLPEYLQGQVKTLDEALSLLSAKYSALAKQGPEGKLNAFRLGNAAGLNDDNTRMLMEGAEGLQKLKALYQELGGGVGTNAQVKANAELWQSFYDLKTSVKGYTTQLASLATPYIKDVVDATQRWIDKNRELHKQRLEGFVESVKAAAKETRNSLDLVSDSYNKTRKDHDGFFDSIKRDYPILYTSVKNIGKEFTTLWNTIALGKNEFKDLGDDLGYLVNFIENGFKKVAGLLDKILLFRKMWLSAFSTEEENKDNKETPLLKTDNTDIGKLTMDYLRSTLHVSQPAQTVTVPHNTTNTQTVVTNNNQIDMRIEGARHPVETGKAAAGAISSYLFNPARAY